MQKFLQEDRKTPAALRHLNEAEVAEMLHVSIATLRRWRVLSRGPKFVKFGAAVRYEFSSVTAWVASRPTGGSRDEGPMSKGRRQADA
jgi:predicted DNA-binding transcriptional regulator AlpA